MNTAFQPGPMAKTMVLIFLSLFPLSVFPQQCGYDNYYLFAIHVHTPNSHERIPGLKMYLTDENGRPCTAEVIYRENKKWNRRNDSLFFWNNLSAPARNGTYPLVQQKFYNIGDCDVVVFRMDMSTLKNPLKQPMFSVKIEAGENVLTGNPYPDQSHFLPLKQSVRLCNNGILDKYSHPAAVKTIGGKEFKVIDILLNEITSTEIIEQEPADKYPKYIIRPEFSRSFNPAAYNREEFSVKGVNIYDATTGKLHQHLEVPGKATAFSESYNQLLETGDYYQRSIREATDFCILIDEWRDTVFNVERKRKHYYLFDPVSGKYQPDTVLNKETDIFYYSPLKTIRRLEYLVTERSKIINTWQLESGKWKLADKKEELFPAFKPKVKYKAGACVVSGEKYHRLPLQAVIGTNAVLNTRDSFLLYNYSEDSIHIISVISPTRDFFSIPLILAPKQYTTLRFNGLLRNNSFDLLTNSYQCYLVLEDSTTLSFSIDIPTVSNNSNVVYRANGTIDHALGQRSGSRFTKAILTDTEGNIRATGMVQDGDTSLKAGKWQYFEKGDWKIKEIIYSKSVTLSALNQNLNYGNAEFRIKVLENGAWKESAPGTRTIYITAATDSIVAFKDSLFHSFKPDYHEMSDNSQLQFYLLKPGEQTLKIGYYQTPFKITCDQYVIIPDYSVLKNSNRTTYQITDSILSAFQKQFPQTATGYVSPHIRSLSLASMKAAEKKKLLLQLEKDKGIAFVCRVFAITDREAITYCNNNVYVELNGNQADSLKKAALDLGFSEMRPEMGNNRYSLNYKSKMIDENFFEAFKKLTELPMVLSAYLNTYFEPVPDVPVKTSE